MLHQVKTFGEMREQAHHKKLERLRKLQQLKQQDPMSRSISQEQSISSSFPEISENNLSNEQYCTYTVDDSITSTNFSSRSMSPVEVDHSDDENISNPLMRIAKISNSTVLPTNETILPSQEHSSNMHLTSPQSSRKNQRLFTNWLVKLKNDGQIVIEGKIDRYGDYIKILQLHEAHFIVSHDTQISTKMNEFFVPRKKIVRSKPIQRILDARTVLSKCNHKYHLIGDLHDPWGELPDFVRKKFHSGFPMDWDNIRTIWQKHTQLDSGVELSNADRSQSEEPVLYGSEASPNSEVVANMSRLRVPPKPNALIPNFGECDGISNNSDVHSPSRTQIDNDKPGENETRISLCTNYETRSQHWFDTFEALVNCPFRFKVTGSHKRYNAISQIRFESMKNYLKRNNAPDNALATFVEAVDAINDIATLAFNHEFEKQASTRTYKSHRRVDHSQNTLRERQRPRDSDSAYCDSLTEVKKPRRALIENFVELY